MIRIILSIISIILAVGAAFFAAGLIRLIPSLSLFLKNKDCEDILREMGDLKSSAPEFNEKIRDNVMKIAAILHQNTLEKKDETINITRLCTWSFILIILSSLVQIITLFLKK